MFIEWHLHGMRTGQKDEKTQDFLHRMVINVHDRDLFTSMYHKSKIKLPGHPLHNQYINYYDHEEDDKNKKPRDTTQIYTPSGLYMFFNMKEPIACDEHREEHDKIPECAVIINKSAASVTKNLPTTICTISQ